jgi:glycosyltransferase involved in cell wall biosynthesis
MKIISYLTEPASYTLDLIDKVHSKVGIDYKFLQRKTSAKSSHAIISKSIFLNELFIFKRIWSIAKDYKKYDIIVFNGYDRLDFIFLLIIHLLSSKKTPIGLESDTQLRIPKNHFKRVIKKIYLNFIFKQKDIHGLAGGNKSHRELFSFYGMKECKIHFLPMVVDVEKQKFNPKRKRSNIFTFIFVGRFIPLKQIEYIIKSFKQLFLENQQVNLRLIGDGPLLNQLKNKYSDKNIVFTGALYGNDLLEEYKNAHALILASNKEQWGLVINEALAAALPVLSNIKVGANYDLIHEKNTGYIFNSDLENDLTNKMKTLIMEEDVYETFCQNAFNLMHDHWNFNLYSKKILEAANKMKNV